MTQKSTVAHGAATAILLFAALQLPAPAAFAQTADSVRPGKWEYTVTTQMPGGLPQLPPGVKLPPNVQVPTQGVGGGMTQTHTTCIAGGDPTEELRRPRGASKCTMDRMQRSGGSIVWAMTCATQNGTLHSEGTGRYTADTLEVSIKSRTIARQGMPLEVSNHVTGRYLGPCDNK